MSTWNDLRVFLAVARQGSLSAASRSLGVNQSTVGRRLDALESALGVRLFDRTAEGLMLTDAGRRCLGPAEAVETSALDLERVMTGEDARLEGPVRVATTESLAIGLLAPIVVEFNQRHPNILVEVVVGTSSVNLIRREADLAVRPGMPRQRGMVAKKLLDFSWGLYATETYLARKGPVLAGKLGSHDVIGFEEELSQIQPAQWLARNSRGARTVLRSNSLMALVEACAAGGGVGVLPCLFASTRNQLRRLPPRDVVRHPLFLVVHPEVRNTARVRAFLDFAVEATSRKDVALRARG